MRQTSLSRVIVFSIVAAAVALGARGVQAQTIVKPKPAEQPAFEVIGIEVRTNNFRESAGDGAIPKQWQRLFAENVLHRVPDRIDQSIVVVYTNYASDWNGDYTYILGARVKSGTKPPEGMVSTSVPGGKYVQFMSARGPAPQVVPDMWKQVWTYFQLPGNPIRAYGADYELYDDMADPNQVQVQLFVGVKP